MGKGKGKFSSFIASVKAFEPIFVLRNVTRNCGVGLANKMRYKLPASLSVSRCKYSSVGNSMLGSCNFTKSKLHTIN